MSAITHVPFYPSDWLAGTRGMTAAEMGVYITLIAMMYERAGPVKADDPAKLARLCGTSASALKGILQRLIDDGKIIETEGGILARFFQENPASEIQNARRWPPGWKALRKTVFERDSFRCVYCGDESQPLECDHIIPVSRGGKHEVENLATSCMPCNRSKHDKQLSEWLQ